MELDPTSKLGAFFEETKGDSPEVRAEKLEAHKAISEVHDEVARQGQTSVSSAAFKSSSVPDSPMKDGSKANLQQRFQDLSVFLVDEASFVLLPSFY